MAIIPLRDYNHEIEGMIENGQLDEAVAHCRHILATFPKHIATYRLLGKAHLEQQRISDAADIFQRVLSAIPDDYIANVGMSIIREDENNLDASIWHMELAYEAQPSNSAIQNELLRLYGRRDGTQPLKVRLTRGALARMYAKGGLFDQATAELRAAIAEDPNRPDMQLLLAQMSFQTSQRVEAIEICTNILKKLPFCLAANQILAASLTSTDQSEAGKNYRQVAITMDPYFAFTDPEAETSDQVPDNAVNLEKLEWNSGLQMSEPAPQPTWATSLGISLDKPAEEKLPTWIDSSEATPPAEPEEKAQPNVSPFIWDTQEVKNIITDASKPEAEIPDWMREAGWMPATGEATPEQAEAPIEPQAPSEPQGEVTEKAEIPDWLRGMAPEGVLDEKTEPRLEAKEPSIPWLDKQQPGPTDSIIQWLEEKKPESPTAPVVPDSTPADISDEEVPEWLKDLDVPFPASTQTEKPAHEIPAFIFGTPAFTEEPNMLGSSEVSETKTPPPEESAEPIAALRQAAAEAEFAFTAEDSQPEETPANLSEDIPDWLKDLAGEIPEQAISGQAGEELIETPPSIFMEQSVEGESASSEEVPGFELPSPAELPSQSEPSALGEEIPGEELSATLEEMAAGVLPMISGEETSVEEPLVVEEISEEARVELPAIIEEIRQEEAMIEEAAPVEELPEKEAPLEEAAPIEEIPEKEAVVEAAAPVEELPEKEAPLGEAPSFEEKPEIEAVSEAAAPVEELPQKEAPLEEAPPVEEIPEIEAVSEAAVPVEELPQKEAPLEEAPPVEEIPEIEAVSEAAAPVEELPQKEAPLEEAAPVEEIPEIEPVSEAAVPVEELAEQEAMVEEPLPVEEIPEKEMEVEAPAAVEELPEEKLIIEGPPSVEEFAETAAVFEEPAMMQQGSEEEAIVEQPAAIEEAREEEPLVEEPALSTEITQLEPLAEEPVSELEFPVEEVPSLAEELQQAEQPVAPESEPSAEISAVSTEAEALAWLERLASQQGAKEEQLITPLEERTETLPDQVKPEPEVPPEGLVAELEAETTRPAPSQPEKIPEWIIGLGETPEVEEVAEKPPAAPSPEPEAQPAEELPPWLLEMAEPGVEKETPGPVPEALEWKEEELPAWLKELAEEEAPSQELAPSEVSSEALEPPAIQPEPDSEWTLEEAQVTEVTEQQPAESQPIETAWIPETEAPTHPQAADLAEAELSAQPQAEELVEAQLEPAPVTPELVPLEVETPAAPPPEQPAAPPAEESETMHALMQQAWNAINQDHPVQAAELYTGVIKKNYRLDEVITDLQDALYRFPLDINLWVCLGDAHFRKDDLQEALNAYTKAEELVR